MWIDKNDNIWIYGGISGEYQCDFWKYNTDEKMWTEYTHENSSVNFGELGIESNETYPGCRRGMAVWYTADDHSLWMAFGLIYNQLADLIFAPPAVWKYSIESEMWMWVLGSDTARANNTEVVKGEFSVNNSPSSRWAPYSALDSNTNVWYAPFRSRPALNLTISLLGYTEANKRLTS